MPMGGPFSLELTLVGTWDRFAADDPAVLARQVRAYALRKVGRRDEDASTRAAIRDRLRDAVSMAGSRRARAVFVCDEVAPGVEMPAVITVFAPESLAPAATQPESSVVDVLRDALATAAAEEAARAVPASQGGQSTEPTEVPAAGSTALRVWRIDDHVPGADGEATRPRHLRADYWVLVPDSHQVLLVSCFTPLGNVPHTMLRMFDAILLRARLVQPTPTG